MVLKYGKNENRNIDHLKVQPINLFVNHRVDRYHKSTARSHVNDLISLFEDEFIESKPIIVVIKDLTGNLIRLKLCTCLECFSYI